MADKSSEPVSVGVLSRNWKPLLLLSTSVWFVFFCLELKYPYYFLQDDNRDYLLPAIVHSYRSLIAGEIAQYNPHQFSGSPFLATGITGTQYPLTYVAAWASSAMFGHYCASVDILVLIHLTMGAVGAFVFLRLIFADERAALWGGLAWQLNSFCIYGTSSWFPVIGVTAYFPFMAYFAVKCAGSFTRARVAGLVTARLLLFYIGYVQYFLYAAFFEALVFAVGEMPSFWERRDRVVLFRSCLDYVATWLCFMLLALPLLLPMWHHAGLSPFRSAPLSWTEFTDGAYRLEYWLVGLFNPFSARCDLSVPNQQWFNNSLYHLGHIGYLTLVLVPVGIAVLFTRSLDRRQKCWILSFVAAGLLSLLWSMNIFAWLAYRLPIVNRFRWPFKLQLFANVFLLLIAVAGLANVLSRIRSRPWARAIFALAYVGTLANFLLLYTVCSPRPFRTHLDPVPLEEPLRALIGDGKIMTLGFRFEDQRSAGSLGYDYATLWGLYHMAGYDPLVTQDNAVAGLWMNHFASYRGSLDDLSFEMLRTLAIRYYVVAAYSPQYGPGLLARGMQLFYKDARRTVYRDPVAKPLIHWEMEDGDIQYRVSSNTIRVEARHNTPDRLHINFLRNSCFSALLDNERQLRIDADRFGQMMVDVPAGSHVVELRYRDPHYVRGLCVAVVTLLFVGLCLWRPALVFGRVIDSRSQAEQ